MLATGISTMYSEKHVANSQNYDKVDNFVLNFLKTTDCIAKFKFCRVSVGAILLQLFDARPESCCGCRPSGRFQPLFGA